MRGEWDEFDRAVARWRAGASDPNEVARGAMSALAAGASTPTLPRLTAELDGDPMKIQMLMRDVLAERGLPVPAEDEALKRHINARLRDALAHPDHPEDAFVELCALLSDPDCRISWDLDAIWFAGDSWAERNEPWYNVTPDKLRADMIELAESILAEGGVTLVDPPDPPDEPKPERSWPKRLWRWLLNED